jgi:hypothetical protein
MDHKPERNVARLRLLRGTIQLLVAACGLCAGRFAVATWRDPALRPVDEESSALFVGKQSAPPSLAAVASRPPAIEPEPRESAPEPWRARALELAQEHDAVMAQVRELEQLAPVQRMMRELDWDCEAVRDLQKSSCGLLSNDGRLAQALETMTPANVERAVNEVLETFKNQMAQVRATNMRALPTDTEATRKQWFENVASRLYEVVRVALHDLGELGVPPSLLRSWIDDLAAVDPMVRIVKERYL